MQMWHNFSIKVQNIYQNIQLNQFVKYSPSNK